MRSLSTFILSLVTAFAAFAAPKVTVEAPVYDFGRVLNTEDVVYTFELKNTGDSVLSIGKIKPACGCTVADISTREILPGASTKITATLDLDNRVGRQHKTIAVQTSDPTSPTVVLTMKGEATTEVVVEPTRLYFQTIDPSNPRTMTFTLSSAVDKAFTVKRIEMESPYFTIEQDSEGEAKSHAFTVTTRGTPPTGPLGSTALIHTTLENYEVVRVPLLGRVPGKLSIAPTRIALPARRDKATQKVIIIRPGLIRDFKVKMVELPEEKMSYQVLPLGADSFRVLLKDINPDMDLAGKSVKIHLDTPEADAIEVPFAVMPLQR